MLTDRVQAEELGRAGRPLAKAAGAGRSWCRPSRATRPQVLLEAAKDFDADLIVVGSRGLTSHAHFILGSVAASVAHHAPCDVLVAHTTKVGRVSEADDQTTPTQKTPIEQAVEHAFDLFVYAPIGLLFEGASLLPELIEKGKSQVADRPG